MNYLEIMLKFRCFDINEHHLQRYINFVKFYNEKNTHKPDGGNYHKHHILPKGRNFWYEYKSFKVHPWNCAILTPRQHFIAHRILYEVFNSGKQRAFMLSTLLLMMRGKYNTLNSRIYLKIVEEHRLNMTRSNPMTDENTVAKMKMSVAKFMMSEEGLRYRERKSESRKGNSAISEEGLKRLSELWLGVKRPRADGQQEKIRQACAKGLFYTPWGNFWSPQQAADSTLNIGGLSRYSINRRCKKGVEGFNYVAKEIESLERRGKWSRK